MTPTEFMKSMAYQFSVPRQDGGEEQEKKWFDMMIRELRPFSPEVLERAATDISRSRKDRRFPTLADCLSACYEAKKWLDAQNPVLPRDAGKKAGDNSESRYALADDLVRGPMGREAARDGWILALHDFIRQNMRLPDAGEVHRIKISIRDFEEAYEKTLRGGWAGASALAQLGDKMAARREELRQMVLGE